MATTDLITRKINHAINGKDAIVQELGMTGNPTWSQIKAAINNIKTKLMSFVNIEWKTNSDNTYFDGRDVWTDGDDIYLTTVSNNTATNYIFNKSTKTWENCTFGGLTPAAGRYVWHDLNGRTYNSSSARTLIFNKITKSWSFVTSNLNLDGTNIWNDGTDIYYSSGISQYVLNLSKLPDEIEWSAKTWNISNIVSGAIWHLGDDIYYDYPSNRYKLNKTTGEWDTTDITIEPQTVSSIFGSDIFKDAHGNIYYSNSGTSVYLYLDVVNKVWRNKEWNSTGKSVYGADVWNDGETTYYNEAYTAKKYYLDESIEDWDDIITELGKLAND